MEPNIIDYLTVKGKVSVAELQKLLSLDYAHARRLLKNLEEKGDVKLNGVYFQYIPKPTPFAERHKPNGKVLNAGRAELSWLICHKTDDGTPLLYVKALQYMLKRQNASVGVIKERFLTSEYIARQALDWCKEHGYVNGDKINITQTKFDELYGKYKYSLSFKPSADGE